MSLSVITDEISQDFDRALEVASEYGVKAVDLRKIWKKNIAKFTDDELTRLKELLDRYSITVGVITGPFGKCVLPSSKFATDKKESFMRNPSYNLSFFERLVEISDFFNTPFIRIFAFLKMGLKSKEEGWNEMINLLVPFIKKAEKKK